MKNLLILILLLGLSSCSDNSYKSNAVDDGLKESTELVADYESMKRRWKKEKRSKFWEVAKLKKKYIRAKARKHFLKKISKKVQKNNYQIIPEELNQNEPNELYVVNKKGKRHKKLYSYFRSLNEDPNVIIMQDIHGQTATIVVTEPGEYEIEAFILKAKSHISQEFKEQILERFVQFKDKYFDENFNINQDLDLSISLDEKKHPWRRKYRRLRFLRNYKKYVKHIKYVKSTIVVNSVEPEICPQLAGSGSESNPFLVRNVDDLSCLYTLNIVNDTNANVKLETDIDFRPIHDTQGFVNLGFWGASLDGNDHTIHWGPENADELCQAPDFGPCFNLAPFSGFYGGATLKNITFEVYNIVGRRWLNVAGAVGDGFGAIFENITVNHNGTIISSGQRAGFIGFANGGSTFKDIIVNNVKVEECVNEPDNTWTGVNGGFGTYFAQESTLENITVNNPDFSGCQEGSAHGFMADNFVPISIKNVEVNNLRISNMNNFITSGFARFITANAILEDIRVNNTSIDVTNSSVGGFLSSSFKGQDENGNLIDADIVANNITIDGAVLKNNQNDGGWNVISGFSDGLDGDMNLSNINIRNLDIDAFGTNVAGAILNTVGNLNLQNLNIENIDINVSGPSADVVVAGIGNIGNSSDGFADIDNVSIKNVSIVDNDDDFYSGLGIFSQAITIDADIQGLILDDTFMSPRNSNAGVLAIDVVDNRDVLIKDVAINRAGINSSASNASWGVIFANPGNTLTLENIGVANSIININNAGAGGLIYQATGGLTFLKNIEIKDSSIEGGFNTEISGVVLFGGNNLSIEGAKLENINLVTGDADFTGFGAAGVLGAFGDQSQADLLIKDVDMNNVFLSTNRVSSNWEPMGILVSILGNTSPDSALIQNIKISNSSASTKQGNSNQHRMMGGILAHIFDAGVSIDNVLVENSLIQSDIYAISGAILGEITLFNGDRLNLSKASSLNSSVIASRPEVLGSEELWKTEVLGQTFGLITPGFDDFGNESRGEALLTDIFANGTITSLGFGTTWARNMVFLKNSLYVDDAITCAIGGGETFQGMNNFSLYCNDTEGITTIVDPSLSLDPNSYPGFDFNNIWEFVPGIDHPTIRHNGLNFSLF